MFVGAVVELRPDGSWTSRPWEIYRYDPEPITTPEEFSAVFRDALNATVERMLHYEIGRASCRERV